MSSGHRGDDPASFGAVIRMIGNNPGLQYFLGRHRPISRKYLVPYGAGSAMDGGMTYVDEGVPERFKMGVEVNKYICAHEGFEWWLMTRKGLKYWVGEGPKSAHWWATGYEHMLLTLDGWGSQIDEYEKEWLTYVSEDEAERISPETVPPDLYTGAYEPDMDTDTAEEQLDDSILQILLTARSRMLEVREARLIA